MREEIEKALEARLTVLGAERVLDVGGGRERSVHATHVIDIHSFEEARAMWGKYFDARSISMQNWVSQDICGDRPFPFPDKFFDFAICCGTLEDIRDPVRVCREMSRVAKAGYVETPSPLMELTRGVDPRGRAYVGYCHHRWLVDVEEGGLIFLFKPHFLIKSRRFHLPPRFALRLRREGRDVTALFWEGELRAREKMNLIREEMEADIERRVRSVRGDTFAMKYGRFQQRVWEAGTRLADRLRVRGALRPVIGWIRNWCG